MPATLIKNYGLFWKVEDVYWGTQNKVGTLYGQKRNAANSAYIDFRYQTGIYVLYADYKIVYVGQTGAGKANYLFNRLKQHLKDDLAGRWTQFSWFGLRSVRTTTNDLGALNNSEHPTRTDVLNQIEAILIHVSEPPLNRQGGKWKKDSLQYLQYRDEEHLGKKEEKMIKEIYQKLITSKK